jgi:glutamyl-tRNA reductase
VAFVEAGAVLADEHLGGLRGRSAVVVGAGTMGELAVQALRTRGMQDLLVLSRKPRRAERLASRSGARHGGLDDLDEALTRADLVVSSTGATGTVVSADAVRRGVGAGRPMFVIDLAVPRDVEERAADAPGVVVADIDDLRGALDSGAAAADEVDRAREIVAEEARRYSAARRAARLAPLIEALHARGEKVRAAELRRMAARLRGLSEREREAVEALSRGIVRTLLHDPVVRLKDLAGRGIEDPHAQVLIELFGLRVED